MNLSAGFIKRPIGTSLLAIGVFVLGLICYLQLSVAPLPKFQIPVIFVEASQAGADASTMASTVTAPLERYLGQIPGIKRMRSSSSESNSNVFCCSKATAISTQPPKTSKPRSTQRKQICPPDCSPSYKKPTQTTTQSSPWHSPPIPSQWMPSTTWQTRF